MVGISISVLQRGETDSGMTKIKLRVVQGQRLSGGKEGITNPGFLDSEVGALSCFP